MKTPAWLRTAGALTLSTGIVLSAAAGANALETAAVPAAVVPADVAPAAPAIAPMALPAGHQWTTRPEAIFDQRALRLPAGSTLSYADAAALLGVGSVADSTWPQNGGPAGRATFNGSGWSGGAGAWALISNPQRYGQLYVLWG